MAQRQGSMPVGWSDADDVVNGQEGLSSKFPARSFSATAAGIALRNTAQTRIWTTQQLDWSTDTWYLSSRTYTTSSNQYFKDIMSKQSQFKLVLLGMLMLFVSSDRSPSFSGESAVGKSR